MKVIVLGTGAIGAYYGAQLARAGHAVTCFARGANLGAIQERGLEVRTPEGGFRAPVTATDRAEELAPADFAILAVKSYSLVDIAPIVRRCAEQETTVVPLLNGVETVRSEEHTSELQSQSNLVCRLLLEKKKKKKHKLNLRVYILHKCMVLSHCSALLRSSHIS